MRRSFSTAVSLDGTLCPVENPSPLPADSPLQVQLEGAPNSFAEVWCHAWRYTGTLDNLWLHRALNDAGRLYSCAASDSVARLRVGTWALSASTARKYFSKKIYKHLYRKNFFI